MPESTLPSIDARDALRLARFGEAVLIDFRKPEAVAASGEVIRGARRRDPFSFSHDDPLTADPRSLVVFCARGHEVGQFACALLLLHGRDARYVRGGFEALKAAGAPLEPVAC